MKYCTRCKKAFTDDSDACKCSEEKYSWERGEIKFVPRESKPECKTCGSTKDLLYREAWYSGNFKFGDTFTCKECEDKQIAELNRQEAMNYIIIDDSEDVLFYETKEEVESYLEDLVSDGDYYEDSDLDILILKIEKIDRSLTASDFKTPSKNTHIVIYDDEIYRVEEVIEPEVEYDGDINVSW